MRSGLGTRNLYAVVHYDAQQQRRFCHADNITRHTDSENLITEFYISEFSFKIGARLSSFAFKRIGERFESSSTIAFPKVNVRTTFRPNETIEKKARIKLKSHRCIQRKKKQHMF